MTIERLIRMTPDQRKAEVSMRPSESVEEYARRMGEMIIEVKRRPKNPEDFIKERQPHYSDKGGHKERSPR